MHNLAQSVLAVPMTGPLNNNREPDSHRASFKGLCVNCDHRFTCTLPKPESGVWYCEEYL